MPYSEEELRTYKAVTVVTLFLSLYGSLKYTGVPEGDLSYTPFSASNILLFIYWGILYLWQIVFTASTFFPDEYRLSIISLVGWHFPVFNVLIYIWSEFFTAGHYILSEIVLLINFFNLLALYFNHKTFTVKPVVNWLLIHGPLTALPLSWVLFALFWNGAVMFHIHKLFGRILANIFIWDFLLVPGVFLLLFNDWAIGFSSAYLMFALAFGQLATKVFALQWIFAFVIAGILTVWSFIAMVAGGVRNAGEERAPLLVVEEETVTA
ncbi:hypothetical protein SBY92_001293 [Candida maltosa Xu316]|uniref:DUF1774-domain-containing protein n=1 Tax=Candida maltosa (strain Xu316) TaxID=1245528 RepID=M3HPV8_CANMX|nr:hypothetical protein G210_5719 [Candida maltosa Xu316]